MRIIHRLSFLARIATPVLLVALLTPVPALADMAPPEQPPGAAIMPGAETTQVRMMSEIVTLTVLAKAAAPYPAQAATEAVFSMRNLGSAEEKMQARFPLTFWNDRDNGFGKFPEIPDLHVRVDGKPTPTQRVDQTYTPPGGIARQLSPWAAFDVTFPPGKDVTITVDYTTDGYGYTNGSTAALRYVMETGAAWNGTIGSADIIVKLPYPASDQNVLLTTPTDFSQTTPGAQMQGNEVRWHFADLEPTPENNITLSLVNPAVWLNIQALRAQTQKYPTDGETWGQLGKTLKQSIQNRHGDLRPDAAGQALFAESAAAYQKSVTLLPKDALWHYGYAELLVDHYAFNPTGPGDDPTELVQAVQQLRLSLALDPKNQNAQGLASFIAGQFPFALSANGGNYDYLILTATPEAQAASSSAGGASSSGPSSASSSVSSAAPAATAVPAPSATRPPVTPARNPGGVPFCGGAALLPALLAGLWLFARRR